MISDRLERALSNVSGNVVSPQLKLPIDDASPRKLFNSLERDSGLRLPSVSVTIIGNIGGALCVIGSVAIIIALLSAVWAIAAYGAIILGMGALLVLLEPGRLPIGVENFSDLVKELSLSMHSLNALEPAKNGAHLPDYWSVLLALIQEYSLLPEAEICPDMRLFREG